MSLRASRKIVRNLIELFRYHPRCCSAMTLIFPVRESSRSEYFPRLCVWVLQAPTKCGNRVSTRAAQFCADIYEEECVALSPLAELPSPRFNHQLLKSHA